MTTLEVAFVLVLIALIAGQLWALLKVRDILAIIAANQVMTHDQAHADVTETALILSAADSQRQTHDPESGEDAVNTKQKSL